MLLVLILTNGARYVEFVRVEGRKGILIRWRKRGLWVEMSVVLLVGEDGAMAFVGKRVADDRVTKLKFIVSLV